MSGESRNPCNFVSGDATQVPAVAESSGSDPLWMTIQAASYGRLARVVAVQYSGGTNGYTVDIFNSEAAIGLDGQDPQELYRVIPTITAADGSGIAIAFMDQPYCCADGNNINRSRNLYVRIKPSSTGDGKSFAVALTIE